MVELSRPNAKVEMHKKLPSTTYRIMQKPFLRCFNLSKPETTATAAAAKQQQQQHKKLKSSQTKKASRV